MSVAAVACAFERDVRVTRWDSLRGALTFVLDGATGVAGVAVVPSADDATALLDTLVVGEITFHLWLNTSGAMYAFAAGVICLRRS
jgi:hypothetical protein